MGVTASPVFDITHIGPGTPANSIGAEPIESAEKYTKIEGPKIKPKPMIPPEIEMTEEQEARLIKYLDYELSMCETERWNQIDKFARLKEKYRTKFPEFPKNFPIPNSSQIVIPIIKTQVNALTARLFQTVMAADPLASVRTDDPDYQNFAYDYECFLKRYDEEKLDMEEVLDTALTECIKLGTSVVEVSRFVDERKIVSYDIQTGYQQKQKELYNGPVVWNIPIEDFWIRVAYQDVQKAPWCGSEHRKYWSEIKDMALSGELDHEQIDKIWNRVNSNTDVPKTVRKDEEIEKTQPHDRQDYCLYRLFVRWDVDGDGVDEDLLVWFERSSRTLLRRRFNPYRDNRRPFEIFRYIKIEHRFYAEGMAEMLEMLQEEISSLHNQRMDSNTINMLKMILTGKAIQGLRPGDPLWPGKIIRVPSTTDIRRDVSVLDLGTSIRDTSRDEMLSNNYVSQVGGQGEAALGQAQPVSRTTAAAQLSLLEELNRRFDKTLKGFRKTIRGIHTQLTDLFNESGTNGLAETWLGDIRGRRLEQYLLLPPEVIGSVLKIRVTSTKATVNREVEFQTNITLMNLIVQHGNQLIAMVSQLAPQVLPVVAHEIISSIRPIFKKVLQYSDYPDPDAGVRVLAFLEAILPAPENMGGMELSAKMAALAQSGTPSGSGYGAPGGGATSPGVPAESPGVANLMQVLGGTNGRLNGVAG